MSSLTQTTRLERTETVEAACPPHPAQGLTQTTRLERTETEVGGERRRDGRRVSPKRLDLRELKRLQGLDGQVSVEVSPKRLDLRELKRRSRSSTSAISSGLTQTTRLERTETTHDVVRQGVRRGLTQTTRLERTETGPDPGRLRAPGDVSPKRLDLRELKQEHATWSVDGILVSPKRLDLRELKRQM